MTDPLAPTTIGERQAIADHALIIQVARCHLQWFREGGENAHRLAQIDLALNTYEALATPTTNAPVADRANDKPPVHWAPDDKCERHPQTAEEWDWHADNPNGPSRSMKRLNYAADRADPHAPDQMALVLRIDIIRLAGGYTHQQYRADALKKSLDALRQTLPIHGEMREALERMRGALVEIAELTPEELWDAPERDTGERPSWMTLDAETVQAIARNALTSNTGSSS